MPPLSSRLAPTRLVASSHLASLLALKQVARRNAVGHSRFSNTARAQNPIWLDSKKFYKKLKERSETPLSKVPLDKRPKAIRFAQMYQLLLDMERRARKSRLSQEDIDSARQVFYNTAVFLYLVLRLLPVLAGP